LVIKIGEIRDRHGLYRNFIGHNINVFTEMGLLYYNEAILITPIGSMPIRAGQHFLSARKLEKGHQNILVFFKGNPQAIREEFPHEI